MWQNAKNAYHLVFAFLVSSLHGFPARGMTVIGVTGTDGKTTTASLLFHILKTAGKKSALISTVGAEIGDKQYKTGFHVTTPDSQLIQSYITKAKHEGVTHLVLEVTSHALDQHRTFGIPFAYGVITNITHEHLDYHGTYERYVKAKLRLIRQAKIGILNRDDASYPMVVKLLQGRKGIITYGKRDADYTMESVLSLKSRLTGEYNMYNLLAASAVSQELGISHENIRKAAATYTPPKGRSEIVYDNLFCVMIDFAHTPNSFSHLLSTIRHERKHGRMIHVFGAAGYRDRSKRPLMGEIASSYDDCIVLTTEDSRGESVDTIFDEIMRGITRKNNVPEVYRVVDRQKAIDFAVSIATKGDIVIITGKGHEETMNLGKGEIAWSDHDAVRKAIETRDEK